MEMGKSLGEVLMSLREKTAPDTPMTQDHLDLLDVVDGMSDEEQALLRDFGKNLLGAIKEIESHIEQP